MNFHDLVFYSKHHYRFECGVEIGGGAAKRAIRIQDSISGNEGYSVTIYDTEENEVLRADRVSMSTKPMKIISSSFDETTMQGWGVYTPPFGGIQIPYSNYGLTIYHPGGMIQKSLCICLTRMLISNINFNFSLMTFDELCAAAQQGDPDAQFELGGFGGSATIMNVPQNGIH